MQVAKYLMMVFDILLWRRRMVMLVVFGGSVVVED